MLSVLFWSCRSFSLIRGFVSRVHTVNYTMHYLTVNLYGGFRKTEPNQISESPCWRAKSTAVALQCSEGFGRPNFFS